MFVDGAYNHSVFNFDTGRRIHIIDLSKKMISDTFQLVLEIGYKKDVSCTFESILNLTVNVVDLEK